MDPTDIRIIVYLLALTVAWPLSISVGKKWDRQNPNKRPFMWGFFQSMCAMLGLLVALLAIIGRNTTGSNNAARSLLEVISVWGAVLGVCGVFMFRRNRWAWVIGIVVSFNPVLWIANGIYLANRWKEMAGETKSPQTATAPEQAEVLPNTCYIYQNARQFGPYQRDQVIAMWRSGHLAADALYGERGSEWKRMPTNLGHPPPVIPSSEQPPMARHGCLTAWLTFMLIVNTACLIATPLWAPNMAKAGFQFSNTSLAVMVICLISSLAFTMALFRWKRWGFWGHCVIAVVALVNNLSMGTGIAESMSGFLGLGLLVLFLNIGDADKAWSRLK